MKKKEVVVLPKTALIVYCHPEPQSWTGNVKEKVEEGLYNGGFQVKVSDLYGMNFNPITSKNDFLNICHADFISIVNEQKHAAHNGMQFQAELKVEIEKVLWATYVVVVCPYWWGGVPAMLKGWFDRVYVAGLMWDYGKYYKTGILKGRKAQVVIATGEAESVLHKAFLKEQKIDEILKTITWGTFHFCGYDVLATQKLINADYLSPEQKKDKLDKLCQYMRTLDTQPILYEFEKH